MGGWQRRIFQLGLLLSEKITAPKSPVGAGALAVDLNCSAFAPGAVDLNDGILAVADNPTCFAPMAIDLHEGVLAIADNFNPDGFAGLGLALNPDSGAVTPVDFNARALIPWRAIVTGKLRRPARDNQSGDRTEQASGSRADRWARRGHKGVQRMGKPVPLGKPKGNAGKVAFSPSCS